MLIGAYFYFYSLTITPDATNPPVLWGAKQELGSHRHKLLISSGPHSLEKYAV
jgi:hypothetical protein